MDPRLAAAHAALVAAQDHHADLVKVYRAAQAAYQRSRSNKNRAALLAASDECDKLIEPIGPLMDAIDDIEATIAVEALAAAEAAERALQPELNLF